MESGGMIQSLKNYFGGQKKINDARMKLAEGVPAQPPAPPAPPPPPPNPNATKDNPAGIQFANGGGLSPMNTVGKHGIDTLQTGKGGRVPGTGKGDKIPAKYEPGEYVVSNDMLKARPELRDQLRALRKQVLAAKGMTPQQADAKAMMGTTMKAAVGKTDEEIVQPAATPAVQVTPIAAPQAANQPMTEAERNTRYGRTGDAAINAESAAKSQKYTQTATSTAVSPQPANASAQMQSVDDKFMPGTRAVMSGYGDDASRNIKEGNYGALIGNTAKATLAMPFGIAEDILRPLTLSKNSAQNLKNGATNAISTAVGGNENAAGVQLSNAPIDNPGDNSSPATPVATDSTIATTEAQKRASGQQGVAYSLNDPASNASILAQNPAGAVRKVGNSYSGSNVTGDVGFVGANGNPISGRPGGGMVSSPAQGQSTGGQAAQSLANPDGSQWSASDNAIMAANIRDGIDPTRGTSRGQPGGASIIGGPAIPGGDPNDLLSANHESMRRASIAATRSGNRPEDKAMRAAGADTMTSLNQQFGQAKQDQQSNARTAMTTLAQQAQTDAMSRNQANANQIAQGQLGLNRQKQTQDNALARDKQATDFGMEKVKQQLWSAYTTGTPEQKAQAAEQLQMLNGKNAQHDKYATHVVKDANGVESVVAINTSTGQQNGQQGKAAVPDAATARTQALDALKANPKNKDEINKRLTAAGYETI